MQAFEFLEHGWWRFSAFVVFFTVVLSFAVRMQDNQEREAYGLSDSASCTASECVSGVVSEGSEESQNGHILHDLKKTGEIS